MDSEGENPLPAELAQSARQLLTRLESCGAGIVKGLPVCPPCLTPFSSTIPTAVPQLFPLCGHRACWECADAASVMDPPRCPVCQAAAVSGFVADVGLAVFADAIPQSSDVATCVECRKSGDEFVASSVCVECGGQHLCDGHARVHREVKGHVVSGLDAAGRDVDGVSSSASTASVALSVASAVAAASLAPSRRCRIHADDALSLMCWNCSAVVCDKCVVDGHVGHKTCRVDEAAVMLRGKRLVALDGSGEKQSALDRVRAVCVRGSLSASEAYTVLKDQRDRFSTESQDKLKRHATSCSRMWTS